MDLVTESTKQLRSNKMARLKLRDRTTIDIPAAYLESVFRSMTEFEFRCQVATVPPTYCFYGWLSKDSAWDALLYWLMKSRRLPGLPFSELVECWMLGHRIEIPEFQDAAMIELLRACDACDDKENDNIFDLRGIQHTRWWEKETEMKQLILEELVKNLYYYDKDPTTLGLDSLEKYPGVMSPLTKTHMRYLKHQSRLFYRFVKANGGLNVVWEEFLVEDGIRKLWQRDEDGQPILGKRKRGEQDEEDGDED